MRRAHLINLLAHRREVGEAMQRAISQLPQKSAKVKALEDMNREFSQRMNYLSKILGDSTPRATTRRAIDSSRRRSFVSALLARPRSEGKGRPSSSIS
jgi:hypothetical protein